MDNNHTLSGTILTGISKNRASIVYNRYLPHTYTILDIHIVQQKYNPNIFKVRENQISLLRPYYIYK